MLPLAAVVVVARCCCCCSRCCCCCCCSVSCGRRYIIRNLHKINKLNMPDMRCAVGRQFWPRHRQSGFGSARLAKFSFCYHTSVGVSQPCRRRKSGRVEPIDNVPKQLHNNNNNISSSNSNSNGNVGHSILKLASSSSSSRRRSVAVSVAQDALRCVCLSCSVA